MSFLRSIAVVVSFALATFGCDDAAQSFVVLENHYPASSPTNALVVYRAAWGAVRFTDPIAPGASSNPQSTVAASANTAYVLLAPGWDPTSAAPPTSFVVLQSRMGFGVHLNNTLHIEVDDATFAGNCADGSPLPQAQADFITELVFPDVFASLRYDAATCTTTPMGNRSAH